MRTRTHLLLLASLLVAVTSSAPAFASDTALGADGVVYTLTQGPYGELFPGGTATDVDNTALALEIDRGEGNLATYLVPGTEGPETETSASLILEPVSGNVYLLWQSWQNHIHSRLFLTGFTDEGWIDNIQIVRTPYSIISSPRLAVTRDAYEIQEGDQVVSHERTVLHLAWMEESAQYRAMYSPIIFTDGEVTTHAAFDLSSLVSAPEESYPPILQPELLSALTLRPGVDDHSVIVSFADDITGQIVGMELQVVPGEITALGESLAQLLRDLFAASPKPDEAGLQSIADRSRGHIIDFGARAQINPALVRHLADETYSYLTSQSPDSDVESIIGGSRGHIIDFGVQLDRSGIRKITGGSRGHIIDFGVAVDENPPGGGLPGHQVRATVTTAYPVPESGNNPELFITPDGRQAILSWISQDGAQLSYRETKDGGWSGVYALSIKENDRLDDVHRLLQRRVDER